MRISLSPLEPGRNSSKFLIFDLVIVSKSGRPNAGPERLSA